MSFAALDYLFFTAVGLSILLGVWRGLVREIVALLTWLVLALSLMYYAPVLAGELSGVIASPTSQHYAAYVLLCVVILVVGWVLGKIVNGFVTVTGLSFINRLLGGIFGLVRGGVVLLLVAYLVNLGAWQNTSVWQHSRVSHILDQVLVVVEHHYPAVEKEAVHLKAQHAEALPGGAKAPEQHSEYD